MKIKLIRQWKRGKKIGDVLDLGDGVANLLIRRKFAVPHEDTPAEDVRHAPARAEFESAALEAPEEAAVRAKPVKKRKAE